MGVGVGVGVGVGASAGAVVACGCPGGGGAGELRGAFANTGRGAGRGAGRGLGGGGGDEEASCANSSENIQAFGYGPPQLHDQFDENADSAPIDVALPLRVLDRWSGLLMNCSLLQLAV